MGQLIETVPPKNAAPGKRKTKHKHKHTARAKARRAHPRRARHPIRRRRDARAHHVGEREGNARGVLLAFLLAFRNAHGTRQVDLYARIGWRRVRNVLGEARGRW